MKRVSEALAQAWPSLKSLGKMLLLSRPTSLKRAKAGGDSIIVMGNGPSLAQTIAEHGDALAAGPAMAVNFAAIAPEFGRLRPRYYIMVDPHFFSGTDTANLRALWSALAGVDWPMTLIVPSGQSKRVPQAVAANPNISLAKVNAVGVEGWPWLEAAAYGSGLGMPRPRNVLIPAIMAAAQMGYKRVQIVGADHTWLRTLTVDDENHVVSEQPHFYKEDDREVERIRREYVKYPLHQVLYSQYVAFESYHRLNRWAKRAGIEITNATPGSMIDAFPRRSLGAGLC